MKANRTTAFFFGIGLLTLSGLGHAEGLLDVYNLATESDPTIRAANAALQAQLEAKPQAKGLLLPTISFNASTTESQQDIDKPTASAGTSNFDSTSYTLSLTQPIYHRDYLVQLRQADAQVAQADANYRAAEQELMVRAAQRYFDVLSAMDGLEFARAEKKAVARQLEQTEKRFEVGLIAITDVHEAKARYDSTVALEIAAENQLSNSREALYEITGQYLEKLKPLMEDTSLVPPDPKDIEQWTSTALKQNLTLIAAQYAADIANQEVKRQRAGHYPTVDLVGSRDYSDSGGGRFGASQSETDSISLQLTVPIYQGGIVSSKVREAAHLKIESMEKLEQQRRTALRSTREAYLGVLAAISQVNALKQALVSSESALEATQAGFEVGTRTIVDVLVALRETFRAKRDYAQARYDYIMGTLRLKQGAGILNASDLEKIDAWLR